MAIFPVLVLIGCSKENDRVMQLTDEELENIATVIAFAHGSSGVQSHLDVLYTKDDICINKKGFIAVDDSNPSLTIVKRSEYSFEGTCPQDVIGTAFRMETEAISDSYGWMLATTGALYKGISGNKSAIGGYQLTFEIGDWKITEGNLPAQMPVSAVKDPKFTYSYAAIIDAEKDGVRLHFPATVLIKPGNTVKVVFADKSFEKSSLTGQ